MANNLLRGLVVARARGSSAFLSTRLFSSEALVETRPSEIGIVSGIPEEHLRRKVVIYSPARTATQQGSGKVGKWRINFLSTQKWENPLMGWTSTGDPYANVGEAGLSFDSEDAAKAFAEKHGWDYVWIKLSLAISVVELLPKLSAARVYTHPQGLYLLEGPVQNFGESVIAE